MAVAFRAAGDTAEANAPSINVTIPATIQVGDVLILPWALNNAVGAASTPSGWDVATTTNGGSCRLLVLVRTAQSGDAGASVTLSSNGTTRNVARCAAYSGAAFVDATAEGFGSNTGPSVPTPTNPVSASAVEVSIAAVRGALTGSPSMTAPGTITKRFDASSGPVAGASMIGLGDNLAPVTAGSLGARIWNASQDVANVVGVTIELRPTAPDSPWSLWNGSAEEPLTLDGFWDGSSLIPVVPELV